MLKAAKTEIERRGVGSLSSINRTDSQRDNSLAYSVIATFNGAAMEDYGSWAGDVMYESWLAKLGSWAEALSMYEQKLRENPHDVNSILGCMRCYDARGEVGLSSATVTARTILATSNETDSCHVLFLLVMQSHDVVVNGSGKKHLT